MILALALACGSRDPAVFNDSTDLNFDFGVTRKDKLDSPYVLGSRFEIEAQHRWTRDHTGWTIESGDPEILEILGQDVDLDSEGRAFEVQAQVIALGEGVVELFLVDDQGQRRGSATAEVRVPDHVELRPHAPMMVGREDLAPQRLSLLGGETTTLAARYFEGDRELAGNGVLDFEPTTGVSLALEDSFLLENRDWLLVTPGVDLGEVSVPIVVGEQVVDHFEFDVVPPVSLDELDLIGLEAEDDATQGHRIEILALPRSGGEPVFGGEATWDVGGDELRTGDLLFYDFDEDQPQQVVVSIAGFTREVTVHGTDLGVRSSDGVSCSSTGSSSSLLWALLGVPLIALRRRRRG
jgi:MYXO-CTERM domain-containing protein